MGVVDPKHTLTAEAIRAALQDLGALAAAAGETVHLVAVGGAVMVLQYGHRESTRDVDVVFRHPRPAARIRQWATQVAVQHSLPTDWLNDGAKGYIGEAPLEGDVIFTGPGIIVRAVPPEVMLATKLSAFRDAVDRADASRVLRELTGTKQEVWERVEPHVRPPAALTKACYAFEELWDELHGHH